MGFTRCLKHIYRSKTLTKVLLGRYCSDIVQSNRVKIIHKYDKVRKMFQPFWPKMSSAI